MSVKGFLVGLSLFVAVVLAVTFPSSGYAQNSSGANFILVNYIGQTITLDLDDTTYSVPGTNVSPNGYRFEIQLAPGVHKYAANVPNVGGSAGEFTIEPGKTVIKGVRLEEGQPVLDRNGIVLEKPKEEVSVFDIASLAAPAAPSTPVDNWQPTAPMPGQGSIVWINYGGVDELTVDLEGQIYKVPPESNGIPGRLQVDVSPGTHSYTVSVPYGSASNDINVQAGQVVGVNVTPEQKGQPKYEVGEKVELPPVELKVSEEDLTSRVGAAQPEATPSATPTASTEGAASQTTPAVQAEGVTVKNFTGDTLIFTINGQAYSILPNAEQHIDLPAGSYNYTASLPYVATTGTVDLTKTPSVELSVAINIARDVLSVYQN